MAEIAQEYSPLLKEEFMRAEPLGLEQGLAGISPRWQGWSVDLPDSGLTSLYPLRENNYGIVLPHIYAERMLRAEKAKRADPLSDINRLVNFMYELNGSVDSDDPTFYFSSLLRTLDEDPYTEKPELAASLARVFDEYKAMREAQRQKVAQGLSHTIGQCELFVVASDWADERSSDGEKPFYTARLTQIVNVRDNNKMNFKLIVSDKGGRKGLMPEGFSVIAGVSAPADIS